MHTRSSSTRPTRRRSPPRISFDHHHYLLAALAIRDGSGPTVRRPKGQIAVDESNAGAFQWDVHVRQERLRSGSRCGAAQGSYHQHADPGSARHETRLLMWEGLLEG